jgi:hypothetical protein
MISMSVVVRAWEYSNPTPPTKGGGGPGGVQGIVARMSIQDASEMVEFVQMAERAFGRDKEYRRLWGALNLTVCMWMYRRMVLDAPRSTDRSFRSTKELFGQCLTRLSASTDYLDWLHARVFTDEHRTPCYKRIKLIFGAEIGERVGKKVKLPEIG